LPNIVNQARLFVVACIQLVMRFSFSGHNASSIHTQQPLAKVSWPSASATPERRSKSRSRLRRQLPWTSWHPSKGHSVECLTTPARTMFRLIYTRQWRGCSPDSMDVAW